MMYNYILKITILIIVISSISFSVQANWRTYLVTDGLADNYINVVYEDSKGVLWIGTRNGLNRYTQDESFITYTVNDGLSDNWIQTIDEDSAGNIYIGTINGVCKFDGIDFMPYPVLNDMNKDDIQSMCIDSGDKLWVGTLDGAMRFVDDEWENVPFEDDLSTVSVRSIIEHITLGMFFATSNGVYEYEEGKLRRMEVPIETASSLAIDSTGMMWIGAYDVAYRYDFSTKEIRTLGPEQGLTSGNVFQILVDALGDVWFCTWNGLTRYDGSIVKTYTTKDGLSTNSVLAIEQDINGVYWIGTKSGLNRYDETWISYTTEDGLAYDYVTDICEDNYGNIWAATLEGFSMFDSKTWDSYKHESNSKINNVHAVITDRNGKIWVGTLGGVIIIDGENMTVYKGEEYLPHEQVYDIFEDSSGNIWIGTYGGLVQYDGKNWTTYTKENGLINNYVKTIYEDSARNLWLGTPVGLSCFDGATWKSYTSEEGLIANSVQDITGDKTGNLWFATQKGISRFDGTEWTDFTRENGLVDSKVNTVFEDSSGNIWFGTFSGVCRYDGLWTVYTSRDGLAGNRVHAIFEDSKGNLWFGCEGGISRFRGDVIPPKTRIVHFPDGIIGKEGFVFEFAGFDNHTAQDDLLFSFAITDLEGDTFSSDWSAFSYQSILYSPPLSSGSYLLHVRSRDKAGNIDPVPAIRSFTIDVTPPTVIISSPKYNDSVYGAVIILGAAFGDSTGSDFKQYVLEYVPGLDESEINKKAWVEIATSQKPVPFGELGVWDTDSLQLYGDYVLRIVAEDLNGNVNTYAVAIQVVTAVQSVEDVEGAIIRDASGQVSLFVPPKSIGKSIDISIVRVGIEQIEGYGEQGLDVVGYIYRLEPWYVTFSRKGVLTVSLKNVDRNDLTTDDVLSLYRYDEDSRIWEKIGGRILADKTEIAAPVDKLGTYAVMKEVASNAGKLLISNLDCQPRAFSPMSGELKSKTNICFILGKGAPVTVKVYDPSGRLKRRLASGEWMNQGSNVITWDGRDYDGSIVVSGLYVVIVEADGHFEKKVIGVINK